MRAGVASGEARRVGGRGRSCLAAALMAQRPPNKRPREDALLEAERSRHRRRIELLEEEIVRRAEQVKTCFDLAQTCQAAILHECNYSHKQNRVYLHMQPTHSLVRTNQCHMRVLSTKVLTPPFRTQAQNELRAVTHFTIRL